FLLFVVCACSCVALFLGVCVCYFFVVFSSCVLLCTFSKWRMFPARVILLFLSRGCSLAWNSAISERWTTPARRNLRFLGGGRLLRVRFHYSWAMDCSCELDSEIPEW